jgi:hypothetical protein
MKKLLLASTWLLPALVLAQTNQSVQISTGAINTTIDALIGTVNRIIPLLLGIAVLVFIWGVIKYVLAASDVERGKAVSRIVWSVVSLAAILAVWGLARLLINLFGLQPNDLSPGLIPRVPGGTS